MKKRIFFLALTLALLLALFPAAASADASGTCGTNLTWTFKESSGALTITGSGAMENYSSSTQPWASIRSQIKTVSLPSKLTSIGSDAFYNCTGLTSVTIPIGVTTIGKGAFENCTALSNVYYRGTEAQRANIQIYNDEDHGNDSLLSATWHYRTVSFNGVVTYRSDRAVYLQNGTEGYLAWLDESNPPAAMAAVREGKQVTLVGVYVRADRSGYHVPQITEAMISNATIAQDEATAQAATIADLDDDLMARLVQVEATKGAFTAAGIQVDLGDYKDAEPLRVVGVLSADAQGRVLLGATVTALHLAGEPAEENVVPATCTEAGHYDEVIYCSVCGEELGREEKEIGALGHDPGEPVQENLVPATAASDGGYDLVTYCTRCPAELGREHVVIPMLPMDPPVITGEPRNVTVNSGAKATFTAKAKGKDVAYRWYQRASEGDPWELIPDAVKNTYTVVGSKTNMGWRFRCGAYNDGGETFSKEVVLTVTLLPPVIKAQPKSAAVTSGKKATFTVKATGKGLTYQWFSRPSLAAEAWTPIDGANRASWSVEGSSLVNGWQFYCRVENGDGWEDSIPATLAVTPCPPVIKTQPKSISVKSGAKAKFTVKANGPGLRYRWFEQAMSGDPWVEIPGANKAEYAFEAALVKNGARYYCRVENDDGFAESAPVMLTVTPQPPKFTTQPKDAKVKLGAKATFKVKASGKNVTYQWYCCSPRDNAWIKLDGETGLTLTIVASEENNGCQYRCRATNADGFDDSKTAKIILK